MALGRVLRGLSASAAARPTSSVPAKEKAAVTNTLQRPLNPEWNDPEAMVPAGTPSVYAA